MLEVTDDLNARYLDAVNRVDHPAAWAEGPRWRISGTEYARRAKIVEVWKGALSQLDFVVMALNSGTLERRGDMVSGRWYVTAFLRSRDGTGRMVLGVYRDEYERGAGEWRFTLCSHHVIHQGAFDLSGAHASIPA